jgi:hypothetical protein
MSAFVIFSKRQAAYSLRNNFSKDDNHGSRNNDGPDTTTQDVVQEDRQGLVDNLFVQLAEHLRGDASLRRY